MKLSEAIRLGAAISEQAFDTLYADGKTCALGSAMVAVGYDFEKTPYLSTKTITTLWPWTVKRLTKSQLEKLYDASPDRFKRARTRYISLQAGLSTDIQDVITYMNDTFQLTREEIADMVEQVEPAEPEDMIRTETKQKRRDGATLVSVNEMTTAV